MKNKYFKTVILFICFAFCMLSLKAEAQLWKAIPPYNVLWPLWSPILSPPDPVTGEPTPLVDYLSYNTLLPVQPAFVWNPDLPYFNILYNSAPPSTGSYTAPTLYYYEPTESSLLPSSSYYYYSTSAFQEWPPTYLNETVEVAPDVFVSGPVPLDLPIGYENFLSFNPIAWLEFTIPLLNYLWQAKYFVNPYLLDAADLYPAAWVYTATYTEPLPVL